MKLILTLLAAGLLISGTAAPPPAQAQELSVDFFYDPLSDHGRWMDVADYGYAWQPNVDDDWQPYTDGHWVHTEAGWTWVSNEPYGWAVYHYGRWVNIVGVGWMWIPDTEWGPAWVSWRRSPTYVGWAPLPPEARFRRNIGFANWVDSYYDIGPSYYRFVETRRFGDRNLLPHFVDRSRNVTIITETTNITQITYVNNMVVNRGPDYEVLSRVSAQPIPRLRLDRERTFAGDPRTFDRSRFSSRVDGDALRIFAPTVTSGFRRPPPDLARRVERVEVNRGWRGPGIEESQAREIRAKLRADAPKPPEELPEQPTFERQVAAQPAEEAQSGATTPGATTAETRPGAPAGDAKSMRPGEAKAEGTDATAATTVPGTSDATRKGKGRAGVAKGETADPATTAEPGDAKGMRKGKTTEADATAKAEATGSRKGRMAKGDADTATTAETPVTTTTEDRKGKAGRDSKAGRTADATAKAAESETPGARAEMQRSEAAARAEAAKARASAASDAAKKQSAEEIRRAVPGASNRPDSSTRTRSVNPDSPPSTTPDRPGRSKADRSDDLPRTDRSRPSSASRPDPTPSPRTLPSAPHRASDQLRRRGNVELPKATPPAARPEVQTPRPEAAPRPRVEVPRPQAQAPRPQAQQPRPQAAPRPEAAAPKSPGPSAGPGGGGRGKGRDKD